MNKYKQFVEETGQIMRMATWELDKKLRIKEIKEVLDG